MTDAEFLDKFILCIRHLLSTTEDYRSLNQRLYIEERSREEAQKRAEEAEAKLAKLSQERTLRERLLAAKTEMLDLCITMPCDDCPSYINGVCMRNSSFAFLEGIVSAMEDKGLVPKTGAGGNTVMKE